MIALALGQGQQAAVVGGRCGLPVGRAGVPDHRRVGLSAGGWLIAAVLGFARARAFGASTRWFSLAAVCLLIYHIQFLLLGFVAILGAQQNDFDAVLDFGAFLNVFVVLGAICSIMGFVRLTNPR